MSGRKRKSEQQDSMLEMGNNICHTITTTFAKISDNLLRMNEVTGAHEETELERYENNGIVDIKQMTDLMDLMSRLDNEKIKLESLPDSFLKRIRLEATDTSLLNASKMLKKLGSGEMEKAMHESDVESTD